MSSIEACLAVLCCALHALRYMRHGAWLPFACCPLAASDESRWESLGVAGSRRESQAAVYSRESHRQHSLYVAAVRACPGPVTKCSGVDSAESLCAAAMGARELHLVCPTRHGAAYIPHTVLQLC